MPVPALYYAATALHTISIPGHWAFGVEHVDKAVDQIPPEEEYSVGRAGARVSWGSFYGLLATLGKPSLPCVHPAFDQILRHLPDDLTC